MVTFLYQIGLYLLAAFALPKMLYQRMFHKKYQSSLLPRMGIRFPWVKKEKNFLIWIHAVSLGETKATVPLAKELKKRFPEAQFVVSSITETGHTEAKKSLSFADNHVYLPFDFNFIMKPLVAGAKPDMVILCESDLWFNFLRHSKQQGAKIALVNGKMSMRSMTRFNKVPFFSKKLFQLFDILCVQNSLYGERFTKAYAEPKKIVVTGNLKLDEDYPVLSDKQVGELKQQLGIGPENLVLTIGSTHDPEETLCIGVLKEIWQKFPHLKVILVPRHPERFSQVAALLKQEKVNFVQFSQIENRTGDEKVILMDAMGKLRTCYQIADLAIVGGSFTDRVGGHNILEPSAYGIPVLFGPHMHTQVEFVSLIKEFGGGAQVNSNELKDVLLSWLENPDLRKQIGEQGRRLVNGSKGATQKTMAEFLSFSKK